MQEVCDRKPARMACAVREARDEDMPAVQAIYAHHVLHGAASFEEEPPSLTEMTRRRGVVIEHGLPYLVAERDGQVVGYSYAMPYHPRSAYRFTIEDSIYIDHRLTRAGIGRALLSCLIDRCAAGQWRQMIAVATAAMPLQSLCTLRSASATRERCAASALNSTGGSIRS